VLIGFFIKNCYFFNFWAGATSVVGLSRMSTTKGEIYLCINESVDLAAAIGDN